MSIKLTIGKLVAAGAIAGVGTLSGLLATSSGAGASGARHMANGESAAPRTPAKAGPGTCEFTDDSGNAVSQINIAEQEGSDTVYWMSYYPSVSKGDKTVFTVTGPGPLATETQTFNSGGAITTPFNVPFWGSDATSGTYNLKVTSKGGDATCSVTTNTP